MKIKGCKVWNFATFKKKLTINITTMFTDLNDTEILSQFATYIHSEIGLITTFAALVFFIALAALIVGVIRTTNQMINEIKSILNK